MRNSGVYVLKLVKGKYYVGQSNDIPYRITQHMYGNGSQYTNKFRIINTLKPLTFPQTNLWELSETLERMKLHGIDNVRGSMFSDIKLTTDQKIMAAQLYSEMKHYCRKCGSPVHLEKDCDSGDKVASWVQQFGGQLQPNILCKVCDTPVNNNSYYCSDLCEYLDK